MKILAGPSIRRTQIDVVYIWFIVDELPNTFEIYAVINQNDDKNNAIAIGQIEANHFVQLGEQLFFY